MDSELVSSSLSATEGSEHKSSSPHFTYTERFYELFPYYLSIGMTPEQYWYGNPRLILNYEKKYQDEMLKKRQEAWLIGAYVKSAVSSTVLVAGLADKDTSKKMPKYADMPMPTNDEGEVEMSETAKELERERLYRYYKQLAKINNKKGV